MLISVEQAQSIIQSKLPSRKIRTLHIRKSAGFVLAQDVFAPLDMPPFAQSSMDGYAIAFADFENQKTISVIGEIPAGKKNEETLQIGQSMKIFTGAALPIGADTVVEVERAKNTENVLNIDKPELKLGTNVRPRGSEIQKGQLALPKNVVLSAAAVGFLAGIGIEKVKVFAAPRVALVITGNELRQAGEALEYGQVYESNSVTLEAALQQLGVQKNLRFHATDDLDSLLKTTKQALKLADILLFTGGVSMGDYDLVPKVLEHLSAEIHFHKVRQRPGKPLLFAGISNKLIFGLPGNPSSVLTCFYVYVAPVLAFLANKNISFYKKNVPLQAGIKSAPYLKQYFKAYFDWERVQILDAQESYKMSSFARANCFVIAEESCTELFAGDLVDILVF